MADDIVSPDAVPPPAPGQPASPVAPVVPGQYSSSTYSGAGIGMVPGAGIGNDTSDYGAQIKKDLFARLGITPYQPNPLTHYLLKPDYQDDTGGWKQGSPPPIDQWTGVPDQGAGQVGGIAGPRISGPSDLDFWLRPFSEGMRGASAQRALRGGFDDSLIGAGFSWREMHEAIGDVSDPGYDPFRDRQIRDAGMTNQMSLFYGSQGREQTRWLINHIREKQRETEWSAGNSGVEQGLAFMGGILGDPSTVLPGNLGVKSFAIANKARQALASGNELRLVSAAHAAYGGLGDAVRTSAIQAGMMIAERALTNSLDPTIPGDVSSDLIIPSVIAGSLGLIQGAAGRYAGRRLALQVHDADFLKPTPPPEPGPIRSWFGQPVVDTVAERVRGLKEKVEAIPELLREKVKEGAKDIAMQDIVGPPQTPPSNGGNFPAGSLATNYGPMRTREHVQSPAGTGFGDPHITAPALTHTKDFDEFQLGNRVTNPDGSPKLVYHGTQVAYDAVSNKMLGTATRGVGTEFGHFFAATPSTSEFYANYTRKQRMEMVPGKRTFVQMLTGRPAHETLGLVTEETAPQIRPTYIQMKNPKVMKVGEITDVAADTSSGPITGQGTREVDVNGKMWIGKNGQWHPYHRELKPMPKFADKAESEAFFRKGRSYESDDDRNLTGYYDEGILPGEPQDTIQIPFPERQYPLKEEVKKAKAEGHDGIIFQPAEGKPVGEGYDPEATYLVFDEKQIRGFDQRYQVNLQPAEAKPAGKVGHIDHELTVEDKGSRELVLNGQSRSAAEFAEGHQFETPSGERWEVRSFDGVKRFAPVEVSPITANNHWLDERGKPATLDELIAVVKGEGAHQPGSVGAQLSPESLAYQESVLRAQGRLVPTGIGLENMPLNPVMRAFQGASVAAMRFAADVASTGGLITRGNAEGIANLAPVETLFQVNWNKRLVDTLRYQQDQWAAYRHKVAGAADFRPEDVNIEQKPDWKRTGEQIGEALKDRFSPGDRGLSYEQFRIRVAEAENHGDRDLTNDAASPYVNATAAKFRTDLYDHAKKRAQETGVFDEVYQASLDQAHSDINAIEKEIKDMGVRSHVEKWTPAQRRLAEEALMARQEDAEFKYAQQKKQLDALRDHGPLLNGTAESYRPRLWDTGKLIDMEQEFFDKVVPWFQSNAGGAFDLTEAVRLTKQIHELISHQNPIFERGDMKALFQSVAGPTSAHARSFTIPDELVKDFLVNDSETLARYHTQQMGKAIEFKERFGSLDAKEQIAEIEQDYRRQIIEANKGSDVATPEAIKLTAQMKTAIEDAQALRDKFYGTYGASPDPHRWDSRTIRMAKQFNNLTMLGMSGISALGDLMRPVMTEGIDAVYGYGIRSLMSESRALIMKMNKQELELEGNGMELQMNVRAMAAADTGDVFGSRGRFEHGLNQANAWNFVANGLNGVNQIDKEWARLSIGGRVNNILLDAAAEDRGGGALRISELDRGRFAAAGIGEDEARRIGLQIKIHGKDFGNITMPNTTAWTDDYARDVYRSAMNQFVNRTVPTPGIGDRPNWASTEWGGLISQYKSFGMGSLIRGGISGLQEGGNRFWYGAAAAVGFAILLNEVRSQLFYGKSTFDKPAPAVIVDGIDRSGLLGWFSDVNRAVETLSGHRLGVKPMLGAEQPTTPTLPQIAGTLGGPTAGQAGRVVSIANDYLSGHPTAQTMRNWRALTPGGTNPVLDPVFDKVLPGNYPKRGATPAPQQAGGG